MLLYPVVMVEILSTTDSLWAGERCAYRAAIAIVLWPAASWISLVEAPAIVSHEQIGAPSVTSDLRYLQAGFRHKVRLYP
jgi:hypothetical protein